MGNSAAVGYVYYVPPIVNYKLEHLPPKAKGLVLWIIEGQILSSQEIEYLTVLPKLEPQVKVIVEMGGDRYFRWTPLQNTLVPPRLGVNKDYHRKTTGDRNRFQDKDTMMLLGSPTTCTRFHQALTRAGHSAVVDVTGCGCGGDGGGGGGALGTVQALFGRTF